VTELLPRLARQDLQGRNWCDILYDTISIHVAGSKKEKTHIRLWRGVDIEPLGDAELTIMVIDGHLGICVVECWCL
jgi:hypothetical protein